MVNHHQFELRSSVLIEIPAVTVRYSQLKSPLELYTSGATGGRLTFPRTASWLDDLNQLMMPSIALIGCRLSKPIESLYLDILCSHSSPPGRNLSANPRSPNLYHHWLSASLNRNYRPNQNFFIGSFNHIWLVHPWLLIGSWPDFTDISVAYWSTLLIGSRPVNLAILLALFHWILWFHWPFSTESCDSIGPFCNWRHSRLTLFLGPQSKIRARFPFAGCVVIYFSYRTCQ